MMQERSTFASVWSAFLVFGSTAASLIFACATPFAALAAVAALTLPPRLALITTMGVWLGNQAVGFLMLGYPLTASALAWGPILGGVAIVATAVAIQVSAQFDRADLRHWLAVFAAALATQQGLVLAASLIEGTASLTVAAGVSALNAVWAAGLAVVHRLAVGMTARAEPAAAR
jgi:hypothetical protein